MAPKQMAENKWVHGVATLLIGVVTPCMTGRGPPCIYFESLDICSSKRFFLHLPRHFGKHHTGHLYIPSKRGV